MVGWTMSVSVHQSNITNIFCQDLKEMYGNIDSKSKIFLTTILSLLGILGVLCNSLVVFCIHKTKQVDIQSIKLYRNFSIIDTFNSIINFVHLKAIIFDPYQTDCMEFYLLRFFLHWAIFSSSYMVPVTGLDRYIHIKYLNNYAIVFNTFEVHNCLCFIFYLRSYPSSCIGCFNCFQRSICRLEIYDAPELFLFSFNRFSSVEIDLSVKKLINDWHFFLQEKHCQDCICLLYTSPSPRDQRGSRMPSSA